MKSAQGQGGADPPPRPASLGRRGVQPRRATQLPGWVRVCTGPAPMDLQPGRRVPDLKAPVSPRACWRPLELVAPLCASEGLRASTGDAEVCADRGCVLAGDTSNPPPPDVTSATPPSYPTRPRPRGGEGAGSQRVA